MRSTHVKNSQRFWCERSVSLQNYFHPQWACQLESSDVFDTQMLMYPYVHIDVLHSDARFVLVTRSRSDIIDVIKNHEEV